MTSETILYWLLMLTSPVVTSHINVIPNRAYRWQSANTLRAVCFRWWKHKPESEESFQSLRSLLLSNFIAFGKISIYDSGVLLWYFCDRDSVHSLVHLKLFILDIESCKKVTYLLVRHSMFNGWIEKYKKQPE